MAQDKYFITKPFRVAYPTLDTPKSYQDKGKPKYSIKMLIPKADKAEIKRLEDWITSQILGQNWKQGIKDQAIKNALKNRVIENDLLILKDGDAKNQKRNDDGESEMLGHAGHLYANVKRSPRVGVPPVYYAHAGENGKPAPIPAALVQSEIYGGCWVRAVLTLYCYNTPKVGASLQLGELQKVRDDEPFRSSMLDALSDATTEDDTEDDNLPI